MFYVHNQWYISCATLKFFCFRRRERGFNNCVIPHVPLYKQHRSLRPKIVFCILVFKAVAVDIKCKYTAEKRNKINEPLTRSFRFVLTGDLERLRRFWFTGACNKPMSKEKQSRSDPLALEQFFSTFLLLGSGILLAVILLLLERVYCRCQRPINKLLQHKEQPSTRAAVAKGCCSLLSRVRQVRTLTVAGSRLNYSSAR